MKNAGGGMAVIASGNGPFHLTKSTVARTVYNCGPDSVQVLGPKNNTVFLPPNNARTFLPEVEASFEPVKEKERGVWLIVK
jgi:hypothetical protein